MSSYKINTNNILALTKNQSNQYQLILGGNDVTDCSSVLINGNLSIGTTDTTYKLNVTGSTNIIGNIYSTNIKNTTAAAAASSAYLFSNNLLFNQKTYDKQTFYLPANKVISISNIVANIETNSLSGLSRKMKLTYGLKIPRMWVAVGSGATNTIAYSTDGTIWTGLGKDIFTGDAKGVAWNGSMWVAVGWGTGIGATNTIAYSTDGTIWTGLGASIFTWGHGVAWNGSMWVAVGWGNKDPIAYSTNGTIWTGLGTSIFTGTSGGVAWNGSMWVAGGNGKNTIAYSTDGTIWTGLGTSIFSSIVYSVASNAARPNTITFSTGNTAAVISGTTLTIPNTNTPIEIVSDAYYQNGLISTSLMLLV
jgi:hypothetical protein